MEEENKVNVMCELCMPHRERWDTSCLYEEVTKFNWSFLNGLGVIVAERKSTETKEAFSCITLQSQPATEDTLTCITLLVIYKYHENLASRC